MDRIHVKILASGGGKWEKQVCSVRLPTGDGSVGILGGHAPMLCAVRQGELIWRREDSETARIAVSDGIANVADDELTILVSEWRETV